MENKEFLVIKNITVENIHTLNGFYTCGLPSLTSYAGFIHAIQLDIQKELKARNLPEEIVESFLLKNFAIIIEEFQHIEGVEKFTSYLSEQKPKKGEISSPAQIIRKFGNIKFHLVIEIECFNLEIFNKEIKLNELIANKKFCGGHIKEFNYKLLMASSIKDIIKENKLNGYFLTKENEIINNFLNIKEDFYKNDTLNESFIKIFNLFFSREKTDSDVKNYNNYIKRGWFLPIHIGYKEIKKIQDSKMQRNQDYEGLVVEPIVSILRLKGIGATILDEKKNELNIFWSYERFQNNNENYLILNTNQGANNDN